MDACGRVMVDPLERRWLLAAPLDTSFGPLLADAPGGNDQASEVVVDGDGRIVVAGQWGSPVSRAEQASNRPVPPAGGARGPVRTQGEVCASPSPAHALVERWAEWMSIECRLATSN